MDKARWVWMPHPGHFIGSRDCRFHLNTYVGGVIVSTVGEYQPQGTSREAGYVDIGFQRKYETMVFKAGRATHKCCPWEAAVLSELDFSPYNDAADAARGHERMCKKWAKTRP